MPGPDQAEIAPVDRRDLCDSQTLGDCNHGYIGRVETSTFVKPDEFGHTSNVSGKQIDQLEFFRDEIKELCVYGRSHVPVDRPTSLDQDGRR